MPKLTKSVVDNAQAPAAGDIWLWDLEVPGFGLRVQASGRKTYVVRYRNAAGTQRKLTVARACDATPDQARALARQAFLAVAGGQDPAASRQEAREAPTVASVKERYMREHAAPFKKARSAAIDEGTWSRHILPKWGTRRAADITKADVLKLQGELADKPGVANQVVALLGKVFNLCEDWGLRPQNSNPCRRLKKYRLNKRSLILTLEHVAAVDGACDALLAAGEITAAMAGLTRLWLITGCRNAEIREARRAWVNLDLGALVLPDSKVGDREIPLPAAAVAVIQQLDAVYGAGRQWLIPGRGADKPMQSPWRPWKRIAAQAGVPAAATPHTLRHTVGSIGHRAAGLSQKQVAMQLGHKQMSTTERYIHGAQSEQAQVASRVAAIMTGGWSHSAL